MAKQETYTYSENEFSQGYLQQLKRLAKAEKISFAAYLTKMFTEHLQEKGKL